MRPIHLNSANRGITLCFHFRTSGLSCNVLLSYIGLLCCCKTHNIITLYLLRMNAENVFVSCNVTGYSPLYSKDKGFCQCSLHE